MRAPTNRTRTSLEFNMTPMIDVTFPLIIFFMLAGEVVDVPEFRRRIGVEAQRTEGALEVRIRADRSVPYRAVEPLLSACANSGVWNVGFTVVHEGD